MNSRLVTDGGDSDEGEGDNDEVDWRGNGNVDPHMHGVVWLFGVAPYCFSIALIYTLSFNATPHSPSIYIQQQHVGILGA
jgi:hypothetical protein